MIGKLADDQISDQSDIGLATFNGMIRHRGDDHPRSFEIIGRILGPFIDVDNQLARTILQLLGYLPADLFERLATLRTDFLLFRQIQDDLYPFQVIRNGNPAGVVAPGRTGAGFSDSTKGTSGSGSENGCWMASNRSGSNIIWLGSIFSDLRPYIRRSSCST